jgi:hypothetical protein
MNYRFVTYNDYGMLCEWWSFWRFTAPPADCLPQTGIMVFDGEIPVCAGFLYKTNSAMCWIEFIVSNPNVKDKPLRRQSISYLISSLCEIGKQMGYRIGYASLKNHSLINDYVKNDFQIGSQNCVELVKILK